MRYIPMISPMGVNPSCQCHPPCSRWLGENPKLSLTALGKWGFALKCYRENGD